MIQHYLRRIAFFVSALVISLAGVTTYNLPVVHALGTESIWPNTAMPAHLNAADSNSVELGVKFTVAVSGTAVGVKFYKRLSQYWHTCWSFVV